MAHQSMMEVDHSDWILSGPYFAVWTAQMDHSCHPLFCFGVICFKLCYVVQKGFFLKQIGITHGPNLKLHGKVLNLKTDKVLHVFLQGK